MGPKELLQVVVRIHSGQGSVWVGEGGVSGVDCKCIGVCVCCVFKD